MAELNAPKSVQTHKNLGLLILLLRKTPMRAEMPVDKKNKASPTLTKDKLAVKFKNTAEEPGELAKYIYHDRVPALMMVIANSFLPEIPVDFVKKLNLTKLLHFYLRFFVFI